MKEIRLEFNLSNRGFTGENWETCCKKILDFKRLKTSKNKVLTGIIESDGVAKCVHCRRLKVDRTGPSSLSPTAEHEHAKLEDLATQGGHESDFVVGADPKNTNLVTVAAPKRAEDVNDGNIRHNDVRLLKFSKARYYLESGKMNARKIIETWNAGVKEYLEAVIQVTSRGAEFQAFREFMKPQTAHQQERWKAYIKLWWAHQRMNLDGGKQLAFTNYINQLSTL